MTHDLGVTKILATALKHMVVYGDEGLVQNNNNVAMLTTTRNKIAKNTRWRSSGDCVFTSRGAFP